ILIVRVVFGCTEDLLTVLFLVVSSSAALAFYNAVVIDLGHDCEALLNVITAGMSIVFSALVTVYMWNTECVTLSSSTSIIVELVSLVFILSVTIFISTKAYISAACSSF
ncbi:MAG: hypothetical protein NC131_16120, partial [Roseburia sp.]|nr:hypothetical protein [Roseburia sp.]